MITVKSYGWLSALMTDTVIIDHDILGWGADEKEKLSKQYKKILKVGQDSELPQRSFDKEVASHCKRYDCDLLTADKNAYMHFFSAGIKTVQITNYGWYEVGKRPIYLVKIIDQVNRSQDSL